MTSSTLSEDWKEQIDKADRKGLENLLAILGEEKERWRIERFQVRERIEYATQRLTKEGWWVGEEIENKGERWTKLLITAKRQPGRWMIVDREFSKNEYASAAAWRLRKGKLKIPQGKWEFVAKGNKVLARYLGEA